MHMFEINYLIQFYLNYGCLLLVFEPLWFVLRKTVVNAIFIWYVYVQLCTHPSRWKSEYRTHSSAC